jgi:hypothetical protein
VVAIDDRLECRVVAAGRKLNQACVALEPKCESREVRPGTLANVAGAMPRTKHMSDHET